jgi:glutamine synthetase
MTRDRDSDINKALKQLEEMEARHLWIAYTDYNGRTQAKSIPKTRFESALRGGPTFAKANLDFNLLDHMPDGSRFTAETGDFIASPDLSTLAPVPYRPGVARALAWMRDEQGQPWAGCPRYALQRQIDAYAERGIIVKAAYEPELALFRRDETGAVVPADTTGMFTLDGLDVHAALFSEISTTLEQMGIAVEQVAPEYGPGQIEINIRPANALKAADDLVTLRDVVKAIARNHGVIGSFMPKPFESGAGNGLHIHLSLWSADGKTELMADAGSANGLSKVGLGFIAGVLDHARALTGLGASTVNSYKRLRPGSWSPAHAVWGIGNRAAMVRVPGVNRPRVEVRCGDNTSQPYLFLAGILAAGLDGIERGAIPPAPPTVDVGHLTDAEVSALGYHYLPRNVGEALDAVEADEIVSAALGQPILGEWLKVKRSEASAYATVVSEWERQVYLDA